MQSFEVSIHLKKNQSVLGNSPDEDEIA